MRPLSHCILCTADMSLNVTVIYFLCEMSGNPIFVTFNPFVVCRCIWETWCIYYWLTKCKFLAGFEYSTCIWISGVLCHNANETLARAGLITWHLMQMKSPASAGTSVILMTLIDDKCTLQRGHPCAIFTARASVGYTARAFVGYSDMYYTVYIVLSLIHTCNGIENHAKARMHKKAKLISPKPVSDSKSMLRHQESLFIILSEAFLSNSLYAL